MGRPFNKRRGKFFMTPSELISGKFLLHGKLVDTKLGEYLGPLGIIAYCLIGDKQTGDKTHDENLICIYDDAMKFMSKSTFSKMKFRLWAYRLIAVRKWGRKQGTQSQYQLIHKWRTLIRMPERLERIHKLVVEYEKVMQLKANPIHKKRQRLKDIKAKIMKVIV